MSQSFHHSLELLELQLDAEMKTTEYVVEQSFISHRF